MHNWQGDPVNSASDYIVDRLNNNQSGAKKCSQSEPVLHRFYPVSSGSDCVIDTVTLSAVRGDVLLSPCQQWGWCLIDHVDRVTMSVGAVDVLLTGSLCQQWGLMSYWPCWQGHPVSSGIWCLIDRVTMSRGVVDVLLKGWPCQQWVLMSYWQGDSVSGGCSCHRILSIWW